MAHPVFTHSSVKGIFLSVGLALLLLFSQNAKAGHPYYYSLDNERGLPSNEAYCVLQDPFGFLWLGCDAGLFRYDGVEFKPYTSPGQKSLSMAGLVMDPGGNIWCHNFSSQVFKVSGDSLQIVVDATHKPGYFPQLAFDDYGNLWALFYNRMEIYSNDGILLLEFKADLLPLRPGEELTDIIHGVGHTFFISTTYGRYYCIDARHRTVKTINAADPIINTRTMFVHTTDKQVMGIAECGDKRDYRIFGIDSGRITHYPKPQVLNENSIVYTLTFTDPGHIWLTSAEGAMKLNADMTVDKSFPHLFPDEKISCVYRDREGNYWFTSLQNGIFVIPSLDIMIHNSHNSNLRDQHVTALKAVSDHEMLVGTYSGHAAIKTANGFEPLTEKSESIYRSLKAFAVNRGTTYISRGTLSVIKNGHEYTDPPFNARDIVFHHDTLYFIAFDRVGFAYPATYGDFVAKREKYYLLRSLGGRSIAMDTVGKTVWFACQDGVFEYRGGQVEEISYLGKSIYANVLEFADGALWIGTVSDGVLKVEKNNRFSRLGTHNGLRGSTVKLLKVYKNYLIVVTDQCVNRIDMVKRKIDYLEREDGLAYREINAIEIKNDTIYLGTLKGLLQVPINLSSQNRTAPNIRIGEVSVNGEKFHPTQKITLTYDKKDLSIKFQSVALRSRRRFSYKYRMRGLEEEWKETDSRSPTARYSSMPGGDYVFEVYAENEDGVRSKEAATLQITIKNPYWRTVWFYILVGLFLGGTITAIFVVRINIVKRQAEIQSQLIASQLKALKVQMNPHFMYNTLNSIQDLILRNEVKETNYYLSRFSTLMRKILDASEQNEIKLAEEKETLELYLELEKLRFGNDFSYTLYVEPEIDAEDTYIPSMIIQPFVENAIKHGLLHKKGKKRLSIIFKTEGHGLLCEITDNGIGQMKAAEIKKRGPIQHKSFASSATKKRLELINTTRSAPITLNIIDLFNDAGEAVGTQVKINIPNNLWI